MANPISYTPKQLKLLKFIKEFIEKNEFAPTYSEIGDHFSITSVSAWENVNALVKKGAVNRKKSESRGIYIRDPKYQPVIRIENKVLEMVEKGDPKFIAFILETADAIRASTATAGGEGST
jgi:SOS-response transcriptional repressor LexA